MRGIWRITPIKNGSRPGPASIFPLRLGRQPKTKVSAPQPRLAPRNRILRKKFTCFPRGVLGSGKGPPSMLSGCEFCHEECPQTDLLRRGFRNITIPFVQRTNRLLGITVAHEECPARNDRENKLCRIVLNRHDFVRLSTYNVGFGSHIEVVGAQFLGDFCRNFTAGRAPNGIPLGQVIDDGGKGDLNGILWQDTRTRNIGKRFSNHIFPYSKWKGRKWPTGINRTQRRHQKKTPIRSLDLTKFVIYSIRGGSKANPRPSLPMGF